MKPNLLKHKCMVQKEISRTYARTAIKACSVGAVVFVEDDEEPLGGKILFDLDKCNGCGKCATACCGEAIEMR